MSKNRFQLVPNRFQSVPNRSKSVRFGPEWMGLSFAHVGGSLGTITYCGPTNLPRPGVSVGGENYGDKLESGGSMAILESWFSAVAT